MTGLHIHPFEDKRPGHVRRHADDFRVHQVGQSDKSGSYGSSHSHHIQNIEKMNLRFPAEKHQCQNQSQRTSVAGQSGISGKHPSALWQEMYRQYDFQRMTQEVLRVIEQAVTQACPGKDTDKTISKQRLESIQRKSLLLVQMVDHLTAGQNGNHPQHAVPSEGKTAEVKQCRVRVPVYVKKFHHLSFVLSLRQR